LDKIILHNLSFYGYHGVMEEEKKLGQKFLVDIELYLDLQKAGQTDNLNYTISYDTVYEIVKRIITEEKFCLLEALAERICCEILDSFKRISKIKIKIKKPEAPISGIFDYFAVQIERER
jgi:dihydroneopterin aldolase